MSWAYALFSSDSSAPLMFMSVSGHVYFNFCKTHQLGNQYHLCYYLWEQSLKKTAGSWVWWLTPVIPILWEAEVGRSRGQEFDKTGQHGETPSLLKNRKLAGHGGTYL